MHPVVFRNRLIIMRSFTTCSQHFNIYFYYWMEFTKNTISQFIPIKLIPFCESTWKKPYPIRFHWNSWACGYVLCRLFVANLEIAPYFRVEATHIPAKLWGKILTKHWLRHLVWTAKKGGGDFCLKEVACGVVGTTVNFSQPEQLLIPGRETMLLRN